MQDSWLTKKAEEIQSFADRKGMKKFHDALKTIYGPKSSGAIPLLSADRSTLLTEAKGGQNTSIVCSIAHHLSMTMLSTDCHR